MLAVSILSGVSLLAVIVAHAAKSGGRTAGWCCTGGRSGNADSVDADGRIRVSVITIGVGAAAKSRD